MTYANIDFTKPEIGAQPYEDTRTYTDLVKTDRKNVPAWCTSDGNHNAPRQKIPYEVYYDEKYAELEQELIWRKCWQQACRVEDIPNVGDRVEYKVAELSYFVVRTSNDSFQAYYNTCRHRGRKLCDGFQTGEQIKCRFHGWTWNHEGEIIWVPSERDFPDPEKHDYSLQKVRTEVWQGYVFINPDDNARPLTESLGVIAEHFEDFPSDERYTAVYMRKKLRSNWKVAQDAFNESYHVVETHWDSMGFWGDNFTKYDTWGDENNHVGRLLTPNFTMSAYILDPSKQKAYTDENLRLYNQVEKPSKRRGKTPEDARAYAADLIIKQIRQATKRDFSDKSDAELVDYFKYNMFPNFHVWIGEVLPLNYRFLPYGSNPQECTMEIRFLLPLPKDGSIPEKAEMIDIGFDEKAADVPGFESLGYVIDQDFYNIPALQEGVRAAKPGVNHPVIGRYQEKIITHYYEVYANAISEDFSFPQDRKRP